MFFGPSIFIAMFFGLKVLFDVIFFIEVFVYKISTDQKRFDSKDVYKKMFNPNFILPKYFLS